MGDVYPDVHKSNDERRYQLRTELLGIYQRRNIVPPSLEAGTQLGPYEILLPIGAGV